MFITQEIAQENKKELLSALDLNFQSVKIILNRNRTEADLIELERLSSMIKMSTREIELKNIMSEICVSLCDTRCDDDYQTKSTASQCKFNNNWTIGMFGSVFVDMEVQGKKMRIHFIKKSESKFGIPFFYVESIGEEY